MTSSTNRKKPHLAITRRQFLTTTGLGAAGATLFRFVTPSGVRIARAQPLAKSGGEVIIAYLARPRSLDPNVWTGYSDNMVMRQIYDPLIWSVKSARTPSAAKAEWSGLSITAISGNCPEAAPWMSFCFKSAKGMTVR